MIEGLTGSVATISTAYSRTDGGPDTGKAAGIAFKNRSIKITFEARKARDFLLAVSDTIGSALQRLMHRVIKKETPEKSTDVIRGPMHAHFRSFIGPLLRHYLEGPKFNEPGSKHYEELLDNIIANFERDFDKEFDKIQQKGSCAFISGALYQALASVTLSSDIHAVDFIRIAPLHKYFKEKMKSAIEQDSRIPEIALPLLTLTSHYPHS